MLDQLKNLAVQQLVTKMASNALSPQNTQAAAEQGANGLVSLLQEQVGGGNLGAVTSLFSNEGPSTQENGIFQKFQGQFSNILQQQGLSAEAAQQESSNVGAGLIDSLKDKFLSSKEEDSAFDISNIAGLLGGGGLGNVLDIAKKLF